MIERPLLARRVAAVRDAVARVREVLPPSADAFVADRTAREIVLLNLFVALQECLALASHWLADEGWGVPATYGEVFAALAEHGILDAALASRMSAATGLRNLIAHRYAAVDWARVHAIASEDLGDLLEYCNALVARAGEG